jgi:hypothetical protein
VATWCVRNAASGLEQHVWQSLLTEFRHSIILSGVAIFADFVRSSVVSGLTYTQAVGLVVGNTSREVFVIHHLLQRAPHTGGYSLLF